MWKGSRPHILADLPFSHTAQHSAGSGKTLYIVKCFITILLILLTVDEVDFERGGYLKILSQASKYEYITPIGCLNIAISV
jgi:hypothetical protein